MQWFRLHNKLLNDSNVQGLSSDHFKIYINLLCYASSIDRGGYIGTLHETAFALRETIPTVTSCFNVLQGVGLIVTNETDGETFQIPQWKKKQYESDSSTDRVKKHREKVKRSKTVTVTAPDTDSDTDTEQIQKEIKTLGQSSLDREFEQVWELYGKKGNRKTSKLKYSKLSQAKKKLINNHIPNYVFSTPDKQYRKGFEVYINQECWNDEVIPHAENRPNGHSGSNRLSAVERVRATNETNRAARANNRDNLADVGGCVRVNAGDSIRGSDAGSLDSALEGSYTVTDQGRAEQDSQS